MTLMIYHLNIFYRIVFIILAIPGIKFMPPSLNINIITYFIHDREPLIFSMNFMFVICISILKLMMSQYDICLIF